MMMHNIMVHLNQNNSYEITINGFQLRTRHVYNGPRTSNLSQQQLKKIWSKMIFEQNQKKFPEQNFGKNKILGKK